VTPQRQLTLAVLACAAPAGTALFAASRTWLVEVTARPDPLPALTTLRSGGSLVPVLPALALVGLAGAGGLLATRGKARVAVAVLIALVGLGIPASLYGVVARPGVTVGWVVVAMVAGLALAGVGALAIRRGGSWPSMGSRYELAAPPVAIRQTNPAGTDTAGASRTGGVDLGGAGLWDALDRGEDPTKG
jgi:hypothetical protein